MSHPMNGRDDSNRPPRAPADVERLLHAAYSATDELPIKDAASRSDAAPDAPPGAGRAAEAGPGRLGSRHGWRIPAAAAAAAAAIAGAVLLPGALSDKAMTSTPGRDAAATRGSESSLWQASATVLDAGDGPQLCLGAVATSYPPQCGGPRIIGWDWAAVSDEESASGVRWGVYTVVGTYQGASSQKSSGTFTLKRPAAPPTGSSPPQHRTPFDTPCPEPADGWVVDSSKAGSAARERVIAAADQLPNLGDLWVDERGGSVGTIVNVSVVGDAAAVERRLRKTWGGPLCVSQAERTRAELLSIQEQINISTPGLLTGGAGFGHVDVEVILDEDGRLQRTFDERYGTGLVRVTSALTPYREASTPSS